MIVAGFGFRDAVTVESLANALGHARRNGTATAFATVEDKAQHPAFRNFASEKDISVIRVPSEMLEKQNTKTQSQASLTARGNGSVAEAAALAAAGPDARLLAPRVISDDGLATCALAEGSGL